MSIIFLVFQNLKEFLTNSISAESSHGRIENLLWKIPTGDKLHVMKLPARLFLAVLMVSIGSFTPFMSAGTLPTDSRSSNCCASMNTDACHRCPTTMEVTTSTVGSSCCATQSSCCTLYFTRATPFFTSMHLIATVGVGDERGTTRAERPPVPPPRTRFS